VSSHVARPVPFAAATPCAAADRDKCDYATPGLGAPVTTAPAGAATGPVRGQGGYGEIPDTTTPPTTRPTPTPSKSTPTGNVDSVPPTTPPGVLASETPAPAPSISGGVSAGHALPVTGAPMGAIVTLGAVMVAGGIASVWYTRRRRSA
jgi:LPXTG-motif cell wall-anchored protein